MSQANLPVAHDVACLQCGYNLRGLLPGGMCPECGQEIRRSLRGDALEFASPRWLGQLKLGYVLLCLSHLLMPLALPAVVVGAFAMMPSGASFPLIGPGGLVLFIRLIPCAVQAWGVWQVARVQALRHDPANIVHQRFLARWLLVGTAGLSAAMLAGGLLTGVQTSVLAASYISLFSSAVDYAGLGFLWLYSRSLAWRADDGALAAKARVAAVQSFVTAGAVALALALLFYDDALVLALVIPLLAIVLFYHHATAVWFYRMMDQQARFSRYGMTPPVTGPA